MYFINANNNCIVKHFSEKISDDLLRLVRESDSLKENNLELQNKIHQKK